MIFTCKEQRITACFYPAICTILARKGKEIERKKHSDCSQRVQPRGATFKGTTYKRHGQVVLLSRTFSAKGMDKWRYLQRHSLQRAWTSSATFKSIHCKGHGQVVLPSRTLSAEGMNKRRYLQRHSLQRAWTSDADSTARRGQCR